MDLDILRRLCEACVTCDCTVDMICAVPYWNLKARCYGGVVMINAQSFDLSSLNGDWKLTRVTPDPEGPDCVWSTNLVVGGGAWTVEWTLESHATGSTWIAYGRIYDTPNGYGVELRYEGGSSCGQSLVLPGGDPGTALYVVAGVRYSLGDDLKYVVMPDRHFDPPTTCPTADDLSCKWFQLDEWGGIAKAVVVVPGPVDVFNFECVTVSGAP